MFRKLSDRALSTALTRDALGTCGSTTAVALHRRAYFWPYNDDFVPEGASTSRFQSSSVPSVRERVIREYAFSPLFGAREPCCVLGFKESAHTVMKRKAALRVIVAALLGLDESQVTLGTTRQMKEMMLYRGNTAESPRLADAQGAHPAADARRRHQYARMPIGATTLLEVYLSTDMDEEDVAANGLYIQEQLTSLMETQASHPGPSPSPSSPDSANGQQGATGEGNEPALNDINNEEENASLVADLRDIGVVYCEVPAADESGFLFDQLHGHVVEADVAERVVERWERRLRQMQELDAARATPSKQ